MSILLQQMMPRQMMVAPGGGVGAALGGGGPAGAVLGGGAPMNGGVAQTQPAVLVQGQVTMTAQCTLHNALHILCSLFFIVMVDLVSFINPHPEANGLGKPARLAWIWKEISISSVTG